MKTNNHPLALAGLILVCAGLAGTAGLALAGDPDGRDAGVARGRYLVEIAGCNDCHTPGYAAAGGATPESEWLLGDPIGWEGPWGTTFAPNLRHYFQARTEAQWVEAAASFSARPPMPWFNVRRMSETDLRAIYRYARSLPVAGEAMPAYLPPGVKARGPVVAFPSPPAAH